jgi:tetratricopeptide (TPR) repeat protein
MAGVTSGPAKSSALVLAILGIPDDACFAAMDMVDFYFGDQPRDTFQNRLYRNLKRVAARNGIEVTPDNPVRDDAGEIEKDEDGIPICQDHTPRWLGSSWRACLEKRDLVMPYADFTFFRERVVREIDWDALAAKLTFKDKPVKRKAVPKNKKQVWPAIGEALERNLWHEVLALLKDAPAPETELDRYHRATVWFSQGKYAEAEKEGLALLSTLTSHASLLLAGVYLETGREEGARGYMLLGIEHASESGQYHIGYHLRMMYAVDRAMRRNTREADFSLNIGHMDYHGAKRDHPVTEDAYHSALVYRHFYAGSSQEAEHLCLERLKYCRDNDPGWLPHVYHQLAIIYGFDQDPRGLLYHQMASDCEVIRRRKDRMLRWARFLLVARGVNLPAREILRWRPLYEVDQWGFDHDREVRQLFDLVYLIDEDDEEVEEGEIYEDEMLPVIVD